MRTIAIVLIMTLIPAICYPVERTEAQRYYDLAVSYIKSDLYVKGLDTLNQVAFLYPDTDVADDALYQLALIRERVGNGELNIARQESLEAQEGVLKGLTGRLVPDIVVTITAHMRGERVFNTEKEKAITQYLLALDYLNTLLERYPDSDMLSESTLAFSRIAEKIAVLIQEKDTPVSSTWSARAKIRIVAIIAASFLLWAMLNEKGSN